MKTINIIQKSYNYTIYSLGDDYISVNNLFLRYCPDSLYDFMRRICKSSNNYSFIKECYIEYIGTFNK
jgi:hypothetical protein